MREKLRVLSIRRCGWCNLKIIARGKMTRLLCELRLVQNSRAWKKKCPSHKSQLKKLIEFADNLSEKRRTSARKRHHNNIKAEADALSKFQSKLSAARENELSRSAYIFAGISKVVWFTLIVFVIRHKIDRTWPWAYLVDLAVSA